MAASFLYHTGARGCCENRVGLFFWPFSKYLVNTCDGPGTVLGAEDTVETKPNKNLSLMGLALWQAQKIEKQINTQGNPRLPC